VLAGARVAGHCTVLVNQAGDAEVQQPHLAARVDQDVGRLEVTVDDQAAVCLGHRLADSDEQRDAFIQRQARGMHVHALAFDIFNRQERAAVGEDATVEQPRDARMVQPRQQFALAGEPLAQFRRGFGHRVEQLQRDLLHEAAMTAFGQIDHPHAASTQTLQQAVLAGGVGRGLLATQVLPDVGREQLRRAP